MYTRQVWATPFLQQGKEMDKPSQKCLLTVLKRIMMVRPQPAKLPSFGGYSLETLPYLMMVKDTTPSW